MTTRSESAVRPSEQADQGGRQWLMLSVLLLGQFMGLLDVTIVNVAMPTIGVDLHASGAALQLVVGGYTVAYAMLLITGARLGDLYGRRRTYLVGSIIFTSTSLMCGLSPTSLMLIIMRFLQGAGAAVMVPQIMSMIQTQFTGKARARALSAYGLVLSVGAVAGLVLGGVLVDAGLFGAGWRPVFLVNVPLGIILALLVPILVPADEPRHSRKLDVVGLTFAVASIFLVVLPLVLGRQLGWPAGSFVSIAIGVVLAAVFVLVERRTAARGGDPLLNLDVLRVAGMGAGLITLACMQITYGGFLFVFALHLQAGLGDSALRAGLTFIPMAGLFGLVGFYWRKLPEGVHHQLPVIGLAMCALSYLGISLAVHDGAQGGPLFWASLVVNGAGMGASFSPLLTLSLVHVPLPKAADASGLFTTTMQLCQVAGIAVFGTVFLSLGRLVPGIGGQAHSSARSIATTAYWQAALSIVGVVAGTVLARTVSQAKRTARAAST
jgi:EmrB/QacA subfamily drug resistance transporter